MKKKVLSAVMVQEKRRKNGSRENGCHGLGGICTLLKNSLAIHYTYLVFI